MPTSHDVLIVSASVAAGHDGAATELARQATRLGYDVDRVDFLDCLPPGLGRLLRSSYRLQLMLAPVVWGWLLPLLGGRRGRGRIARLATRLARKRLLAACTDEPCLVISTYPLASQALGALRVSGELRCPVATFLTDMSVHPLWVSPGVDTHLALHDVPALQAAALGARDVHVVGPAVSPAFAQVTALSRRIARSALDLPEHASLALVVAGSWGVGDIARTVDDLLRDGLVTPVVVCGTNRRLLRRLRATPGAVALGWVDDMAGLMQACDLVVQNAGGLTSLEARQSGLPVITYRSLPGHGHTNSGALEAAGWAPWIREPDQLPMAILYALDDGPTRVAGAGLPWGRLTGAAMSVPA